MALARLADGKMEIWAPVQSPQAARDGVAERLGLAPEDVTVNVTLLGGGFGRKSKADFVAEAAILSKAMDGKPVKVTWTREDDLKNDYFHTVSVERVEAGLDAAGKPVAWLHRTVAPTILAIFMPDPGHEAPFELSMGAVDMPFAIPNIRVENGEADAHTRIGWFRSVSNIPHAFAVQSFAAEMAHAAGKDPKDYLLELIGPPRIIDQQKAGVGWNYGEDPKVYTIDTARLRRVVELAMELAHEPRLLLLDEPSAGLAHAETEALRALLVRVRRETGCSMLLVEHDLELVRSVADEVIVMDSGQIVARGAPDDILGHGPTRRSRLSHAR